MSAAVTHRTGSASATADRREAAPATDAAPSSRRLSWSHSWPSRRCAESWSQRITAGNCACRGLTAAVSDPGQPCSTHSSIGISWRTSGSATRRARRASRATSPENSPAAAWAASQSSCRPRKTRSGSTGPAGRGHAALLDHGTRPEAEHPQDLGPRLGRLDVEGHAAQRATGGPGSGPVHHEPTVQAAQRTVRSVAGQQVDPLLPRPGQLGDQRLLVLRRPPLDRDLRPVVAGGCDVRAADDDRSVLHRHQLGGRHPVAGDQAAQPGAARRNGPRRRSKRSGPRRCATA